MEFRGMLILLQLCSCWTDPWQPLITFFSMLFTPGELMGSESFRWLFLGIFHVAFMSQRFLSSSWMLLPLQCFIPIQSRKRWRYSFLIHQLGPRCGIPSSASLQHNDMGRWPITKQLSETVCLFDVMYLVFWGFPVMHSSRHVSCLDSVPQADLHGRVSESEPCNSVNPHSGVQPVEILSSGWIFWNGITWFNLLWFFWFDDLTPSFVSWVCWFLRWYMLRN